MADPRVSTFRAVLPDGRVQTVTTNVFRDAGDEIPLHEHTYWHSCCCMAGRCELFDDNGKSVVIEAGQFAEFSAGRKHGIRALLPGTVTVHVNEPGH